MGNEIITVSHVTKKFKNQVVLSDVSLTCNCGEICGIIGHNGSGKTVLFKCICGFLKLDEGEIMIRDKRMGRDLDMLDEAGIIIDGPAFLGSFSGIDNLEFLYRLRNKGNKPYLMQMMELVGLEPLSPKRVSKYSMGMKQRLAIAQAIMEDQSILILDEPMNGLDKRGIQDMRSLFLNLKSRGKTILLASHNKEDIDILCDRVYEMENGTLIHQKTEQPDP